MCKRLWFGSGLALLLVAGVLGCSGGTKPAAGTAADSKQAEASEKHDGWWCVEHGMPEGICAQCDAKLAAENQKKGDWCKQHNRPESQCFICHPDLEAKFAAQYEAKYGKKPPKPEGE